MSRQVYFVPQRCALCEQILKDTGVLQRISIREYPLDLIPLDSDLLSLELEGAGPSMSDPANSGVGGGDWNADPGGALGTGVAVVTHSLQRLQAMFGTIPNVLGQGPNSRAVLQRLMRLRREVR